MNSLQQSSKVIIAQIIVSQTQPQLGVLPLRRAAPARLARAGLTGVIYILACINPLAVYVDGGVQVVAFHLVFGGADATAHHAQLLLAITVGASINNIYVYVRIIYIPSASVCVGACTYACAHVSIIHAWACLRI